MMTVQEWVQRIKVLLVSLCIASVANYILTGKSGAAVSPLEALPGLLILAACVLLATLVENIISMILPKNFPDIVYISLAAILISIPGLFPFSEFCIAHIEKVELMSLITVLMAYTGISVGKDLNTFRQQGISIVVVSLITFFGTFFGSVIIGQAVLSLTGVI
ncbi:MAG: hypothetical protein LKE33_11850 [Acidaminococcus sp.]|jgi:hypothetical protein|nr:hypothetical protein [Acidaminococcus sp.]MCI2099641.1 hypothetical protein [Acidaminococcus sp.]MCI2113726.1 hypothetical protein [Acidaminococcus sp.]MCI2115809.1 hypothetical protein [Acidaminococcus sp.]